MRSEACHCRQLTGMIRFDHHSRKIVDLKTSDRELLISQRETKVSGGRKRKNEKENGISRQRDDAHESFELATGIVGVDVQHILVLVLSVGQRWRAIEAVIALQLLARRVL